MRQQPSGRRPRGRSNRKQYISPKSQIYDSHGPNVRVRGNAVQVYEKYLNLARDASSAGDWVAAEGYYQFAEHFFRIGNDSTDPQRAAPVQERPPFGSEPYPVNADQPYVPGAAANVQAAGNSEGHETAPKSDAADGETPPVPADEPLAPAPIAASQPAPPARNESAPDRRPLTLGRSQQAPAPIEPAPAAVEPAPAEPAPAEPAPPAEAPRRRGRPRKVPIELAPAEPAPPPEAPRRRGRPRKVVANGDAPAESKQSRATKENPAADPEPDGADA